MDYNKIPTFPKSDDPVEYQVAALKTIANRVGHP
jgi:hypothetical protein